MHFSPYDAHKVISEYKHMNIHCTCVLTFSIVVERLSILGLHVDYLGVYLSFSAVKSKGVGRVILYGDGSGMVVNAIVFT